MRKIVMVVVMGWVGASLAPSHTEGGHTWGRRTSLLPRRKVPSKECFLSSGPARGRTPALVWWLDVGVILWEGVSRLHLA